MKKLSLYLAAGALVALSPMAASATGGFAGATAAHTSVQGRSGTIAFLRSLGNGPSGLFAIRADGGGLRRLTPSGVDVSSYAWAPDGSRIAYLDRQGALRLVRLDGRGRELLAASSPLRSPWFLTWSPDGKAIAVLAQAPAARPPMAATSGSLKDFKITVIPTEGGATRVLPTGDVGGLAWSPRGAEIAYETKGRTWVIRSDGSDGHPLHIYNLGGPTWSPNGKLLGFVGAVRRGPLTDRYAGIYVADADGSMLHQVTSHAYNEYGFAWSPGGNNILYGRADREGIYVIGADGRNNHRLTRDPPTPSLFPALSWAPDGRSIAYETDRTGNGDIYVIGADGHDKVRLTNSPAHDGSPSWQPQ